MSAQQLCFDFDQFEVEEVDDFEADNFTFWEREKIEARAYWNVGMVTSLPLFCEVLGSDQRYTQMLPGVVESIDGELASVRIYAAPEWGYRLENYPLHLKLAVKVELHALGKYHLNDDLQKIVNEGKLSIGCQEVAAALRAREEEWRNKWQ